MEAEIWSTPTCRHFNFAAQESGDKSPHSKLRRHLIRASLLALFIGVCGVQSAYAGLTITPVSWNVIGLDSNNPSTGPDTYQIGARVCNTGGSAVSNVTGTFLWDSSNAYINLTGNNPVTYATLNA